MQKYIGGSLIEKNNDSKKYKKIYVYDNIDDIKTIEKKEDTYFDINNKKYKIYSTDIDPQLLNDTKPKDIYISIDNWHKYIRISSLHKMTNDLKTFYKDTMHNILFNNETPDKKIIIEAINNYKIFEFNNLNSKAFMIYIEDDIVSSVITRESKNYINIEYVYTNKEHRKKGYSSKLINTIFEYYKKDLLVEIIKGTENFYSLLGFKKFDKTSKLGEENDLMMKYIHNVQEYKGSIIKYDIKNYTDYVNKNINENAKLNDKKDNILRIMTYNVHYFTYPNNDPRYDTFTNIEDIKSVVRKVNPDIICFQEYTGSHKFDGYTYLQSCHYPNILHNSIFYRNGLQVEHIENIDIGGRRCAIIAKVTHKHKSFVLVNTHFSLSQNYQILNIINILKYVNKLENVVIVSDSNSYKYSDYTAKDRNVFSGVKTGYPDIYYLPIILEKDDNYVRNKFKKDKYVKPNYNQLLNVYNNSEKYIDTYTHLNILPPKNTTDKGGRIDFIYMSKSFIDNFKLINTYTYFDTASDHLPIIADIDMM